ncbi:DUF5683 domain-containing protein [Rapidithrix thailandica]|uniref:DUF5683 domain-containing protein n=1 Tax=Rapidithrix thailandica TaxID=413964 RepID=A0AAW9S0G3_9BACT
MKPPTILPWAWKALLCIFMAGSVHFASAQKKETVILRDTDQQATLVQDSSKVAIEVENKPFVKEPTKVALLSAILPGAGQARNKQYWKIPIIYGGFAIFASIIKFNHDEFIISRNNLAYLSENRTDLMDPRLARFNVEQLRQRRDIFRRNRDYSIILVTVFWGINIVDAAIDAHFKSFDVSDDLSAKIVPSFTSTVDRNIPSISLVLTF